MGVKRITAAGIGMAYALDGPAEAPVVALANSLASDMSIWDALVPSLTDRYRVLRYDLRGHGGSEASTGDYSIPLLGDDFIALLDALGIGRVHLVGLSIGGMIAQYVAATAPERVQSLVLCATASEGTPGIWEPRIAVARRDGLSPLVDATLSRWFTPGTRARRADLVAATGRMILATSVDGYAGCSAALRDLHLTPLLGAIRSPTLLIAGDEDVSTSPASMEALRQKIGNARLVVLAEAAHMLPLERPTELAGLIRGFLDRAP